MGAYSSKQEIEPKVGGGPTFRSGPSFARVRYYEEKMMECCLLTTTHSNTKLKLNTDLIFDYFLVPLCCLELS